MTRINARVDAELARKVKYLRERTGQSTTGVLRESIEAYYARVTSAVSPLESLGEFVGCADGPSDLSATYKQLSEESLEKKAKR